MPREPGQTASEPLHTSLSQSGFIFTTPLWGLATVTILHYRRENRSQRGSASSLKAAQSLGGGWGSSSCLAYLLSGFAVSQTTEVYAPGELSGRGPTHILRQQESLWASGGPARRAQLCPFGRPEWVLARPGPSDPAGEPWPLPPHEHSSSALSGVRSLLERAVLTLWFFRRGLGASTRRWGCGSGLPKGNGKHYCLWAF